MAVQPREGADLRSPRSNWLRVVALRARSRQQKQGEARAREQEQRSRSKISKLSRASISVLNCDVMKSGWGLATISISIVDDHCNIPTPALALGLKRSHFLLDNMSDMFIPYRSSKDLHPIGHHRQYKIYIFFPFNATFQP